MLDTIKDYLTANSPDHLRELWSPDMETQLSFQDGSEFRIPKGGNSAEPSFHDHDYHPPADSIRGVGVTGWNWTDNRSEFVTTDLDSIANHGGGHDQHKLDELVQRLSLVDEVEIIRSKSGNGYHLRQYWGDNGPRAFTRAQHTFANPAQEVYRRLEAAGIGQHSLSLVKAKLSTIEDRFAAGLIK